MSEPTPVPASACPRPLPPPGYKTQSEDTSYEAEKLLFDLMRELPPWEKARRIAEDSRFVEHLALMGLRQRHPGASEEELRLRLGVMRLGKETVKRISGWEADAAAASVGVADLLGRAVRAAGLDRT